MRIFDPCNEHGDELLTKKDANSNFPTKTEVANSYLSQNDASSTYLSKSSASSTYLSQSSASSTYLSQASASSTYATKTSLNDKADKTALDTKADKSQLEAKADKSEMELKADKSQLEAKADKTELETKVSTDQVVSTTVKLNKYLINNTLTITASDVSDIANWAIYQVEAVLPSGQRFQIMSDYTKGSDGSITMVIGDGRSLDFSNVIVNLIRESSSGVQSGESLEILVSLIDETIASGDKEAIQELGAKLAATGAEEYTLAGAKTGDEAVALMTGQNMGAFSSPIATWNGSNLVLNDTNFSYNIMSLENAWNENAHCGLFTSSNVKKFNTALPCLEYGAYMFAYGPIESWDIGLPSLTSGYCMFWCCSNLTSFTTDLPKLTDGEYMFCGCSLPSFTSDLPKLEYANYMFANGPFVSWDIDLPALTSGNYMFEGCNSLTTFTAELPKLTSCYGMFNSCISLTYCEPKNCKNSTALNQIIDSLPSYDKADGSHMILFSTGDEVMNNELTATALLKGWGVGTEDLNGSYYYYGSGANDNPYYYLVDGYGMFSYDSSLTEWHYDMPNLTNGYDMFNSCSNLTSFTSDLPSLTNGRNMFQRCSNLTSFNTDLPSLKECGCMFSGCYSLSSFASDLPKLEYGNAMFDGCDSLTYCEPKNCTNSYALNQIIDSLPTYDRADGSHIILFSTGNEVLNDELTATALLKGWSVGTEVLNDSYYYYGSGTTGNPYYELVDGAGMFSSDGSLVEWKYDIPNLTNGYGMFQYCTNLTTFTSDLPSLTNGYYMFGGCSGLTSFTSELPSLTNGSYMFFNCSNLTSFTSDLPSLTNVDRMFYGCNSLTSFTGDLSSLTNGQGMFSYCTNLTSFTSDLPSLTNGQAMFQDCSNLTSFTAELPSLTNGSSMFYNCKLDTPSIQRIANSLPTYTDGSSHSMYITSGATTLKQEELDAHKLILSKGWNNTMKFSNVVGEVKDVDFSGITDASRMFYGCKGLTSWTVALPESLTNASNMFSGCSGLKTWTVALPQSLTNASYMFYNCTGLKSWTAALPESLTDASNMFEGCSWLGYCTAPLPESLTNASGMFSGCTNLNCFTPWGENEDGTFKNSGNTGNLKYGYYMFHNCKLDLASVKRIADWLPQRTSSKPTGSESSSKEGWIHISVRAGVNSGDEFNNAISKMTSKNWSVVICFNGSHTTK